MVNGSSHRASDTEDPFSTRGEDGRTLHAIIREKVFRFLLTLPELSDADRYDITDAAILTAYRTGRLDPTQQPVAYVKQIAVRQAQAYLRKRSHEDLTGDFLETCGDRADDAADPADSGRLGNRAREDRKIWEEVDDAIQRIPAQQCREVMERQSHGEDDDSIASDLGTAKNTVYQQRKRGVSAVEEQLKNYIRPVYKPAARSKQGER
ncbi:RNA polymerase sigma factor [Streptomyces sp. NPDC033754]|uniref:RNA polymerase sigma factor n=1 Tax=unclassified Streptomyces TaxID=2593676 RepID=UPI00340AFB2B